MSVNRAKIYGAVNDRGSAAMATITFGLTIFAIPYVAE